MSSEVEVEIAVQPPHTAGVNRVLRPALVARTRDPHLLENHNTIQGVFATAVLFSASGDMVDCTAFLEGTYGASAQLVVHTSTGGAAGSSRGSSRRSGGGIPSSATGVQWLYFIFDPLRVTMPGTYTFNVVVSALSLELQQAVTVGSQSTRQITIVDGIPNPESAGRSCSITLYLGDEC